jgi:hypothetical protein
MRPTIPQKSAPTRIQRNAEAGSRELSGGGIGISTGGGAY